MLCNS